MWSANVLTLFPEMFPGPLVCALPGKGLTKGVWQLNSIQIRDFATDKHKTVDDTCYGPNPGMIMKPDVIDRALHHAANHFPGKDPALIYMSPRGKPLLQKDVHRFAQKDGVIILCGRYEGVDDRVIDYWHNTYGLEEICIGDYILSGGELAAMVLIDACVRTLPNILHNADSLESESFELDLLEFPQYTKPYDWRGMVVPDILLSGNHAKIAFWQQEEAEKATRERRPDLWEAYLQKGNKS